MKIIITGASGFLGRHLCRALLAKRHVVIALSRNPQQSRTKFGAIANWVQWDGQTANGWGRYADGADVLINLAGANLAAKRWSAKVKKEILTSRVNAGKAVVEAVNDAHRKPRLIVQASAVGFYGSRGDEFLDENSGPGTGFLSSLVQQWETTTQAVEEHSVRRVVTRFGLVLDRDGGILSRQIRQFRLFVGGPLGTGEQWFPWVHLEDVLQTVQFLCKDMAAQGVYNVTAPNPIQLNEFCRILGQVMKRPSWLAAPKLFLRLFFGEMADEALLASHRAYPRRLQKAGYKFRYPDVESALEAIFAVNRENSLLND